MHNIFHNKLVKIMVFYIIIMMHPYNFHIFSLRNNVKMKMSIIIYACVGAATFSHSKHFVISHYFRKWFLAACILQMDMRWIFPLISLPFRLSSKKTERRKPREETHYLKCKSDNNVHTFFSPKKYLASFFSLIEIQKISSHFLLILSCILF